MLRNIMHTKVPKDIPVKIWRLVDIFKFYILYPNFQWNLKVNLKYLNKQHAKEYIINY